jgi:type IV fimbrial biogenesis protein FimT
MLNGRLENLLRIGLVMMFLRFRISNASQAGPMRGQIGFTLLELLVTIAVAGIVFVVVMPGLSLQVDNNRRASAVNEFLGDLHLARSEAIARNMRISICPSDDGTSCGGDWSNGRLVFVDGNGDGDLDAGEAVLRVGGVLGELTVSSSDFTQFLSYRPNGRMMVSNISDNTGEITFCDHRGPDHAMLIIVSNSGRPYTSHKTADGGSPSC